MRHTNVISESDKVLGSIIYFLPNLKGIPNSAAVKGNDIVSGLKNTMLPIREKVQEFSAVLFGSGGNEPLRQISFSN